MAIVADIPAIMRLRFRLAPRSHKVDLDFLAVLRPLLRKGQPRPQGLLAFQYGGCSGEDPGT